MNKSKSIILLLLFFFCSHMALASLSVPTVFSDGMILQRQKPILIWGSSGAGQQISISFNHQIHRCQADGQGKWRICLPKMNAGGPYTMVLSDNHAAKVQIHNILIGEVWLCAGQSNMNFILAGDRNAAGELKIDNDKIREYRCPMPEGALNPENADHSKWISAVGIDAKSRFSAVAYYFAKRLQEKLKVPVGIVIMSCGATRCESWTNSQVLETDTALHALLNYWSKNTGQHLSAINNIPGKFYADVVKNVAPFCANGLIWYQGESNTLPDTSGRSIEERACEYRPLLRDLITSYRQAWDAPNLPVYIVQLPNYRWPSGDIDWARIRQAQLAIVREIPNTGLVVTIDVGDTATIHPTNKKPVGERLALWALARQYGVRGLTISGPMVSRLKVNGNKAIIKFNYMADSLVSAQGRPLTGFEIADARAPAEYKPALAYISHDQIVVSSESVQNPVGVRYAWADDPVASLFNSSGLPASPFMITKP